MSKVLFQSYDTNAQEERVEVAGVKNRILRLLIISAATSASFALFYAGARLGGWWMPVFTFPAIFCVLLAVGNLLPTLREMWGWLS